jgi:hypothetical protein
VKSCRFESTSDANPVVRGIAQSFGVRLRTSALARSSFARFASAFAFVGKDLLARRPVWPFRTYHSNEPSAHLYRRT